MKNLFNALAVVSGICAAAAALQSDGLWKTFGHQTALPLTTAEAIQMGWIKITDCDKDLGILYAQQNSGPSEKHPLALYFTAGGQIAGLQATVYGSNRVGDAAPENLVKLGYWKTNAGVDDTWHMDISFRAPEEMCQSNGNSTNLVGDRVVINQDSAEARYSIPLTAAEAREQKWTQGSCMSSMGQHHFYDLSSAPEQSWKEDQLLPIVPMYNPPDSTGVLHAFFFASPVSQPGSGARYLLSGAADWESPALIEPLMCENWCDQDCHWATPSWATMHIYLNSAWEKLECPNGSGPVGQSCDLNP